MSTLTPPAWFATVVTLFSLVANAAAFDAMNEKQFKKGKQQLDAWLRENPDYEATGPAYAVYWNGPYVPNPFKRAEVHLPITRSASGDAQASR